MNLGEEAYFRLFEKTPEKKIMIKFSGKFKPFNANVKYAKDWMTFYLSNEWRDVDKEITIGLLQSLLLKVHKERKDTTNIDLYHEFSKGLSKYGEVTESDPVLLESFYRVNEKFFENNLEAPNLKWGDESFRTLGKYEYNTNTITISTIFKESDPLLLDYVMYHEMLHKKHSFKSKDGRHSYHSSEFRADEAKFPNQEVMEKKISYHAAKHRRKTKKRSLLNWFRW
ncbi:MAG: hypothetical protein QW331_02790 [Candidatus Woesearchaeota archaeon]